MSEQAVRAVANGADGVVVTAPLYAINDQAEINRHFRMIASSVDVPVFAYDVPVRVHSKLGLGLVMDLAKDGVIAGLKDSSGDDVAFRRLVAANAEAGSPLSVLTGHEVMVDGMLLLGADGVVPGLGNVDPAGYARMWKLSQEGDWVGVRAEQDRLAKLFEIVFVPQGRSGDAGGIGAFKAALEIMGVIESAPCRLRSRARPADHEASRRSCRRWACGGICRRLKGRLVVSCQAYGRPDDGPEHHGLGRTGRSQYSASGIGAGSGDLRPCVRSWTSRSSA